MFAYPYITLLYVNDDKNKTRVWRRMCLNFAKTSVDTVTMVAR